jgi:hypothetical protein
VFCSWCIVAICKAVESNKANAEAVWQLEAQNSLQDTYASESGDEGEF